MNKEFLLIKKAELLEIECELNAAIAANEERFIKGEANCFSEEHFESLASRCRDIQNKLMTTIC